MQKQAGKIYMIPAPLSEGTIQRVLSPQVKEVLSTTKYFFVENIRTSRRMISEYKLGIVIEELVFFELSKDTPLEEIKNNFKVVLEGHHAGVISEAGCPGVADPGSVLVEIAHKAGVQVIPLVGPSSILLALMASGMNGQSFAFQGYLPIQQEERAKSIKSLELLSGKLNQTQLFIETPYRNNQLLEMILQHCKPSTKLCIASDITGANEYIRTQKIQDWKKQKPDLNKIPTIFLILSD